MTWYDGRKFRSQTSDNMDRWKSRGGKSQRGEEPKREDQRRERVRKKKMQVREKVGKSRNTLFFQWFVAPEGRKVGSLKRRVRSHVVRWEMKNCTPLWREAHFQVNIYTSKSECTKHHMFAPLLDVEAWFCVAGARDSPPCPKWAKREGFVAFPKMTAGVGHLKRICKDGFSVAGAVQETCSSELLGGQAADFVRGVPKCWSIRSSGLRRWFWLTGAALWLYDLAPLFRGRRSTLHRWSGTIRKTHWYEAVSSAFNFPFLKEVLQNSFAFEIVKFKHWGSLAELLHFSSSNMEEALQNCFIFKVVTVENGGSLAK